MKLRMLITILLAALLIQSFSGCSLVRMAQGLDNAGDAVEERIDAAADAVQTMATPGQNILTKEEAQDIALKHAGFTADQVRRLRTEYEIDDGVPRFEVQFRQGRFEYDYEINAETGDILSYDRDD